MTDDAMPDWQDQQFITRAEFTAMPREEKALVESDPNKWQWEWETDQFFNAHHPGNDEWLQMRQAAEARAMLE